MCYLTYFIKHIDYKKYKLIIKSQNNNMKQVFETNDLMKLMVHYKYT